MKEYVFTELGFFTQKNCERIKNAMEGRTYMHFHISWSNCAGNCTLIVATDYNETEEHIKQLFLYAVCCLL